MNEKLARLAEQRERLVALAATQRTALAQNIELWRIPLARVDQGLAALRVIKRNPALIVGGVVLLVVLRPLRITKWVQRGWVAWQMVRGLRRR
ncbi:MAG: YqjK family protein [Pseudomonadota bacterium]|nr:YqjK family protein [Pseudomonadota bacterium]